ncbi:hypothetical protein APR50_23155 [Variovorax paradoxus]|jgi:hypothetical protein|uniref:hypothetical protein n=1 Tax=Variovorax paradoxus TaxID=34073 RepID=UPI0006E69297|nr:hypothetical protein APR52_14155 [Variovorax paradoxus]KPV04057.1 hypothetical protein APR50_23155 [Variovorax paradoxus]KPV08106.1 hypothetical protein APR49_16225 [Variovorax paradoxus]KPV22570.1 hypothetical protein APR51_10220 [Variovorax paradoxus]KPV35360.1 hypothetical protein APR48_04230 [Variovorax paradoxus]
MPKTIVTTQVQYIGRRPDFTDRLYGSGLTFDLGQTREVPSEIARKLLRHADQFRSPPPQVEEADEERGEPDQDADSDQPADDTAEQLANAQKERDEKQRAETLLQDMRDQVNAMTEKDALKDFAQQKYQQAISKTLSVENMKLKVLGLIDEFGLV